MRSTRTTTTCSRWTGRCPGWTAPWSESRIFASTTSTPSTTRTWPGEDKFKDRSRKLVHQICSTRPPTHAPPHHPQHKSLLCDPGKSRLWKFKLQSKIPKFISCFCTYKGNVDILMVFTFNFLGAKVNLPRRELRAHSSSCRPCVPSLSGWLSIGCHCHW